MRDNDEVRLLDTKGRLGRYFTLSHCWGGHQPLTTTMSTLADRKTSIAFSMLPKTFQDAVIVSRRLGERYLWIDSLCIIQDNDPDWQTQSAQMASIYENSALTIAALSAKNGSEGLFTEQSKRYSAIPFDIPLPTGDVQTMYARMTLPHILNDMPDDPVWNDFSLLRRGWVYQERSLSQRILYFGRHELLWECSGMTGCECFDPCSERQKVVPQGGFLGLMPMNKAHSRRDDFLPIGVGGPNYEWRTDMNITSSDPWYYCVVKFLTLNLTFEKDIFPALSGLAKRMARYRPGCEYHAGLWLSRNKLDDLCWEQDNKSSYEHQLPSGRTKTWRAPTWSWASIDRANPPCLPPNWSRLDPQFLHAELIDAHTKLLGVDKTGQITGGCIVLRAPVQTGSLVWRPYSRESRLGTASMCIESQKAPEELYLDLPPDAFEPALVSGDLLHCLRLGRLHADQALGGKDKKELSLCLRKLLNHQEDAFERVGLVYHTSTLDDTLTMIRSDIKIV